MEAARGRHDRRRDRFDAERDDFGQADFSTDFAYDPDHRTAHRMADEHAWRRDDYGQADYSQDYVYDADRARAYRRYSEGDRDYGSRAEELERRRMRSDDDLRRGPQERSWRDHASGFFAGRDRRRGPSDRVLWAVIVEHLEDERALDLRDVEVLVEDAEVTLNGTVRRKADKRRIEDIADLDGVRHVQNNLRVRDPGRRWF
jgi:hypothetical protein